jgi:hypothetical protein
MPIGWTVEVTTEHPSTWGPRTRSQLFDLAIEDKGKALEAVRHHARGTVVRIVAKEELAKGTRLSPGRIRSR